MSYNLFWLKMGQLSPCVHIDNERLQDCGPIRWAPGVYGEEKSSQWAEVRGFYLVTHIAQKEK